MTQGTCYRKFEIIWNQTEIYKNSWTTNWKFDLCQSPAQNCSKIWFFEICKNKRFIFDDHKSWEKSISCCSFIFFLISTWPKEHVIESLKWIETKMKPTKILEQPIRSLIYEGFFERLRIIPNFFGNAKSGINFHLIKLQTLLVPSQVWGACFDGKHR